MNKYLWFKKKWNSLSKKIKKELNFKMKDKELIIKDVNLEKVAGLDKIAGMIILKKILIIGEIIQKPKEKRNFSIIIINRKIIINRMEIIMNLFEHVNTYVPPDGYS